MAIGSESPLSKPLAETEEITLVYNQNEVTFDYVALHFANPESNIYTYQLAGFDTDWIDAGNKRSVTYTNLPEGQYTLKVKTANADGTWNNEATSINLTILPPWYRTLWAYGAGLGMLGFLVFGFDRVQRRRISKKEQVRQTLRDAELRAEAENKRRADTELLSQIGRTITSTLSLHKIIETIYENVNALIDAAIFGVGIYNKEKNCLEFPATKEKGKMLTPFVNNLDTDDRLAVDSNSNTPLNPLSRGEAELSPQTDLILEILDDIESNLKTIHKHVTRADSIVKSMLMHSRGGNSKIEQTPLNPLIKEYVNPAYHGMRAGKEPINVDIGLQLDDSIGEVTLIAEDFNRVIVNLTNNAFDAMQDAGHKAQDAGDYEPKLTVRTRS